jgi:type I site-specific restriction endonuclease
MDAQEKKKLSEWDICTTCITPAITASGWDHHHQIREEVNVTKWPGACQGQFRKPGRAVTG